MIARRLEGFAASLLFAAVAALSWPAVLLALGPWLGSRHALFLHLGACAALYLARFGRARLRAARRRPLRGLAVEVALATLALALARAVGGPGPIGTALAIWAFGLAESAWFLVGRGVSAEEPALDPFEEALRRARAVLDGEP
jgi:hypothetical protein